ncbi:MAG: serpin family protein [Thermoguttaceae bacterium]
MRLVFSLTFFFLGVSMSCETSAEPIKPSDSAAIVRGDNQFAVNLYAQLEREQSGKDLFFSPTSISVALAMTAAGARGPTQSEMAEALHLDANFEQAHAHYHRLLEQWNAVGEKRAYQLRVANRLWGQKGYPVRPEFLALTRQQYGAEMLLLDFAAAEAARREINEWVEQQTNGKIKDLIPPGSIGAMTRLVLTNAVYFKANWLQPFDKQNTREEDFAVSAQEKVKVPLMHLKSKMGYAEEETFQVLELPYAGQELSMVVLLPKKVDGLPELEKAITVDKLASLMSKLHVREVNICLPKFKLETSFDLNSTLQAMGMKRAFTREADFSGISSAEALCISAVIHKAYVDVYEEGTEAAAATAVVIRAMATRFPQPVPVFRADHPFLFLIRDTKAGSILFMGRLTKPAK